MVRIIGQIEETAEVEKEIDTIPNLSAKETEVVRLIAEDLTNAEISKRLNIGPDAVKARITSALKASGKKTRVGLALLSIKHKPKGKK